MRLPATQGLTDGTLFYIIEQGVKLTGMPAWGNGTPEGETASWNLVHFIRRLPKLTDQELDRMKEMNPKTPEEWREEEDMRRFLERDKPKAPVPHRHKLSGVRNASPLMHAILALILLLVATVLGVYKPLEMTAYGRRKQDEQRQEFWPTASPRSPATPADVTGSTPWWGYLSAALAIGVILALVMSHLAGRGLSGH